MSSWAYVLDVITTRISALGTDPGADTRSLQADSCMGSFSIRGCLGKEKKIQHRSLSCSLPAQGLGTPRCSRPATPPLAGRTVSPVLSWGQLVESCPVRSALPDRKRKYGGLLESLIFFVSPCSRGRRRSRSTEQWTRGSEPRFCSLLAV